MAKTSNKQYAHALYEISIGLKGSDLDSSLRAFVELLVRNHKLKQAHNIIDEFISYTKKQEGVVELEITSARQLDEKTIEIIKKAFGEKVEAIQNVDEDLIGGVRVKMGDKILDGSLKSQLRALHELLSR